MNRAPINPVAQERPFPARASFDEGETDRAFLDRFVADRDEAAFAALVERHGPMVLEVCQRVLHDVHEAEDACQATFLVLARKAGTFRRPELLANWLYGVAYRAARKTQRQTMRHRAHAMKGAAMQVNDPTAEVISRDLRPVLDEELDRLPVPFRAAVVLCYLEGLKTEEAARQLGCARGTILSRLARARDRLRSRLAKRGLVLSAGFLGLLLARKASASSTLAPTFVDSTAKAACAFAVAKSIAISGNAQRTAQTVLAGLFLAKLKLGVTWLIIAGIVLVGVVAAVRYGRATSPPSQAVRADDEQSPGNAHALEDDEERLQGTWRVVELVDEKGKSPFDQIKDYRWTIDGNGFTMVGCHAGPDKGPMKDAAGKVMQFHFRLDASRQRKSMDISVGDTPCYTAIYELDGDTLRVCTAKAGSPRPTGYIAEGDRIVWVFKRAPAERVETLPGK